ncbi:MAG: GTPase domain-containing protein [Cardiobacteriaceae bacterium]|nr:GTPase domain-containing protein [Cardiobacteriaceae bacterium]
MNNASGMLRKLVILLTTLIILVVLLIIFQFTDVAFRVWDRLQQTPGAFLAAYIGGVALIAAAGAGLIFRIWTVGRGKKTEKRPPVPLSLDSVRERADAARAQGVDTSAIDADLEALAAPDAAATLEVAFFGKISTGKSSLIRTLLPNAHVETSVIGGSTASTQRYSYDTGNLTLTLLDMPGTHQAQQLASQEESLVQIVRRVHLVVYVLDQDMTESDVRAIDSLHGFGKPLIVALNKANRYREADLAALKARIQSRLPPDTRLVVTASAHPHEVQRVQADGSTLRETRLYRGEVGELLAAFAELGARRADLTRAQQQALLALANDNLSLALRDYRRERGEAMVKAYARKAMLGGVAAVGPGTDILIQGYLGMDMVKALTKLYDVPVRDVDVQHLIEEASGKVKSQLTLILALTGNICKAFPGLGTVLGGASHAVAYGLIFESLGRAALAALERSDGQLTTQSIMNYFEDELQHDLEKRAKNLVKTVLDRG